MSEKKQLIEGIYEALLDEELGELIDAHPEVAATLEKLDDEAAPHTYNQFVWHVLHQALRGLKKDRRFALVNMEPWAPGSGALARAEMSAPGTAPLLIRPVHCREAFGVAPK